MNQATGLITHQLPIWYTKFGSSIVCSKKLFWYKVLVTFHCRNTQAVNTQNVIENSWHHEAQKCMWQWSILAVSIQTRKWQWHGFWQRLVWFHLSDRLTWVTSHEIPPLSQKLQTKQFHLLIKATAHTYILMQHCTLIKQHFCFHFAHPEFNLVYV